MRCIFFVVLMICCLLPVQAQIANADFEQWVVNQANDWSLIDSGIELKRATAPTFNGSQSASVTVNTDSQSATDLRQSIIVQANQTYQFQVSVYHTQGGVRARLYVDGFRGYSDPGLRNQWQTIRFDYTATQTRAIQVGLRFYDVAGFVGSEVVYVDAFQPALNVASLNRPAICSGTEVTVNLLTDNYASETAWQVINNQAQIIASGANLLNNTRYTPLLCLADGEYQFSITDAFGDGICCNFGQGAYRIEANNIVLLSGGQFSESERKTFIIGNVLDGVTDPSDSPLDSVGQYYQTTNALTGFALKTALHLIIDGHAVQGYTALWSFISTYDLDAYYENDGSVLDIYSENPNSTDNYRYNQITDQCGGFRAESDCYNREHSFPRNWFGGAREPMNSDVHHIFPTDGFVNGQRSNMPYGEVLTADFVSRNGSRVGSAANSLGYSGTVFEPIDEFKGDIARAQFYMATRYENQISGWQSNSSMADAVLNGTSTQVFESWYLALLKRWHQQDPVSQKEVDRNNAAFVYQGNRNPFVDHPEFVELIW